MINTPHPSSTPRDARTVSDLNVAPGRIGSVADWATRSETLLAEAKPELWSKLDSIPCLAGCNSPRRLVGAERCLAANSGLRDVR